jgi:integrase
MTDTKKSRRARRGRGEASIFQRDSDGLWVGTLSLGYDGNGKRRRRTVYGSSKKEVADKLDALRTDVRVGIMPAVNGMTTGAWLQQWLNHTARIKVRDGCWDRYRQVVDLYLVPTIGGVKLSKVSPIHVEQCYSEITAGAVDRKPASAWTCRMAGLVLTMALKHAVKMKLIPTNPAAGVPRPKPVERERKFLTDVQSRLLLEAAKSHRLYALFATAIGTGMRQGELFGLRWSDIDLDKGIVEVSRSLTWVKMQPTLKEPKSKTSRRSIVLPRFVVDALRDHRTAALKAGLISAPIFCTKNGTYIARGNFTRSIFHPTLKRANAMAEWRATEAGVEADLIPVGVRFHDLRHSHASALIAAGYSVKAVSRRLGHSDITITLKVYSHLMPNDDEKLASGAEVMFG